MKIVGTIAVLLAINLAVQVHAYELTARDHEILNTIAEKVHAAIASKGPEIRAKYMTALHLFRDKHKSNERITTVIGKAIVMLSILDPTESQKRIALQMTTLCENAPATKLQYNYAENIGDGRGITFGIIGFTTGTFDANMLIRHYTKLQPQNNLKQYIPALDALDAEKHDADGKNGNTRGLDGFIEAVEKNRDPLFRKSQLDLMDSMYWIPAMKISKEAGVRYPLSLAFIYDMTVNHGAGGAKGLIRQANQHMGGSPKDGINEKKWLSSLMDFRYAYLKRDYPKGLDRINAFKRLLDAGNTDLQVGFAFTVYGGTYRIDGEVY